MKTLEYVFIFSISIIFYTYIGYGILLYILVKIKRFSLINFKNNNQVFQPKITIVIPAYNEIDFIEKKMLNTINIDYPKDKIEIFWVTDGSDDGSEKFLSRYKNINIFHEDKRQGKINAMNRVVPFIKTNITVFTDANALLNKESISIIASKFEDKKIGCVSGEKRITEQKSDKASGAGEGFYWKYESFLKKLDSELYSAVGAAGELFAVRTNLYEEVEKNVILDDFIISLRIAMRGYKIAYTPNAYAIENGSASIKDEFKRKIRICAGGIQSIIKLLPLLNIFKYRTLSFQYISHRVLRWTITPILFIAIFPINIILINIDAENLLFTLLFKLQFIFYILVIIGYLLRNKKIKLKIFHIPYYFFFMNISAILGIKRYLFKNQSVLWEKVNRG